MASCEALEGFPSCGASRMLWLKTVGLVWEENPILGPSVWKFLERETRQEISDAVVIGNVCCPEDELVLSLN